MAGGDLVPRGPDAPSYGGPQVDRQQLSPPRVNVPTPLAAFGGGEEVSRAFASSDQVSDATTKLMMEEKQNADQVANLKRAALLGQAANELHAQAVQTHGENSFDLPEKMREEFQKRANDIGRDIVGENQRVSFMHQVNHYGQHLDRAVQLHVAGERGHYDDQTTQSALDAERNTALLNYGDEDTVYGSAQRQEAILGDWGKRRGVSDATLQDHIQKTTSATYAGSVDAMLSNGQDKLAEDRFKTYSEAGFLTGDDKDRLAKRLDRDTRLGDAQRTTDKVFTNYVDWETKEEHKPPTTLEDALSEARQESKKFDEKTREMVEEHVRRRWQENIVAKKDAEDKAFEAAGKQMRDGGFDALRRSDLWDQLTERDKEHYESVASRRTKGDSDYAQTSDGKTVTEFYAMSKEDMASLSPQDLERRIPLVKEGEYIDMVKHWKAARDKEDSTQFNIKSEDEKRLFDSARDAGLAGLSKTSKMDNLGNKADAYNDIRNEAAKRLRTAAAENGNKLPQDQRQQIIDDLVIEKRAKAAQPWIIGGHNWGLVLGDRPLDVSDEERARISKVVRRFTGKDASEEKIQLLKRAEQMKASPAELRRLAEE
jgi:hypothetical protein